MVKSTGIATARKGASRRKSKRKATRPLPYQDFPLFHHANGRWAKKVNKKLVYFGKVDEDPNGEKALDLWKDQQDDLRAGRTPRPKQEGFTLEDLCDLFLSQKDDLLESGELVQRTYDEYFATCQRLLESFGKSRLVDDIQPDDFKLLRASIAKIWGPVRLGNEIQRTRSVFKFGFDSGKIDRPLRFGPAFKRPSAKTLRIERAKKGQRMFEAAELGRLLVAAGPQLRAMILLALNTGFGNADVGLMPMTSLDLRAGWVRFPRPKTGVERRIPLWPETTVALKAAIAERPAPKDAALGDLVFITKYGKSWHKETPDNPISNEFRKLLDTLGLHRPGLGFYCLRHTFETIGGETKDQVAVNAIMGHVDATMAGKYRERISDERLKAVVSYVRGCVFPTAGLAAGEGGAE